MPALIQLIFRSTTAGAAVPQKTENFPEPAIAAGLKRGKEINRAWRFPDGYREILLPVRKSLTKKSGIIGLPTGAGQDSLVYDGRG